MRKTVFYLIIVILLSVFPSTVMATGKVPVKTEKPVTEIPAEVKTMLNRLEGIKDMDKSNLNSSERKELRKEVREIKKTLRASGRGIYISTGAIIIILLVLLLL